MATATRCEFWECKRSSEADNFWVRKRSERLRELLMPLGIGYRVVTGDMLCRASFLSNAKQLRRFAKHPTSESVVSEATLRTGNAGQIALDVLAGCLVSDDPVADVLALIYAGTLRADLALPLTRKTLVRLSTDQEETPWVWQLSDPAAG